jgi:hypothetical protein
MRRVIEKHGQQKMVLETVFQEAKGKYNYFAVQMIMGFK